MKKKNIYVVAIVLILLVFGILVISYINKDNLLPKKEKIYSFTEFELLLDDTELLSRQSNVDDEIFNLIEDGDYTLDKPLVKVNPYDISPLTAIVAFKTATKTEVTATLIPKDGGKELIFTSNDTDTHIIPIYGLYIDYINNLELKDNNNNVSMIEIPIEMSGYDSYYFPEIEINSNNLKEDDNDFIFLSSPLGTLASAHDQKGELRWFLQAGIHKQLTYLANGNLLLSSMERIDNLSLGFIEIDLLGKIYNSYELEYPYLNNYVELPNGNILYSSSNNIIVEFNLKNGMIVKTYDLNQMINMIDSEQLKKFDREYDMEALEDFGLINTLDYDSKSGSILAGIYHYSTLINFDKSGNVNWILANPDYYSSKFNNYLLKPTNNDFEYPLGNHNAKLKDGKLTLMNNAWDLSKTTSCTAKDTSISSAKDYLIDFSAKTVTESWKYEKDHFSFTWGDYRVNDSEKVIMFGREFIEYDEPMETCKLPDEGYFASNIIVLDNEEEVFNITAYNSFNFVEKKSIISNQSKFKKIKPNHYTAEQISDPYNEVNYQTKYQDAILYSIPLELTGNSLTALYYEDNYKIVLLDEYGMAHVYNPNYNVINFKKRKGNSLILIEKEGEIYNTGYYINT